MIFRKHNKVLVVNPNALPPKSQETIVKTTRLPIVIDRTLPTGFEIKRID